MTLTKEDLLAISQLLDTELDSKLKAELQPIKAELQPIKAEMQSLKAEVQSLKVGMKNIELHLENATDKNIQLLAENFIELTKKLNQAIPVADKNLAYEVKVNYLTEKVQALEKEIAAIKSQIA